MLRCIAGWLLRLGPLILFAPVAFAALYVTDQLEITLRTGPGTDYKIQRMVPSGTALERTETRDGWARVRTPGGEEGWVVERYLSTEPPKGPRLAAAEKELEQLRARDRETSAALEQLRATHTKTTATVTALEQRLGSTRAELERWQQDHRDVVALRERGDVLDRETAVLRERNEALSQRNTSLETREKFYWFFSGVAVLVLGWGMGYMYASSRQRAKQQSRYHY